LSRLSLRLLTTVAFAFSLAACSHISMVTPQTSTPAQFGNNSAQTFGMQTSIQPSGRSMTDTWSSIHTFQVFDFNIDQQQAQQDAYRYDFVWGSGKPAAWKSGNSALMTSWYAPFDGDFSLKHDLSWWLANHRSWVLYKCDGQKLASLDGLKNVPLDISNPAVVRWQMATYAPGMENANYDGLAEDLVSLNNATGGCGVYVNGQWTQRFTGEKVDPAWSKAVLAWHAYAYNYLHGLSRPLLVAVNNVPESQPIGDADEQQLIKHVDIIDDESSFTNYGTGYASSQKVGQILAWMKYVQNQGVAYIVDDKWNVSKLNEQQFDWGLSTYMLGKYHYASVFIDHLPGYGQEYWVKQYKAKIGSPCADFYPDPNDNGVLYRKFSNAFVVVNSSATQSFSVNLPKASYTDIWGNTVTSPLHLSTDDSEVLLTTNGCT